MVKGQAEQGLEGEDSGDGGQLDDARIHEIEEIINQTYPGLAMYVRDVNLPVEYARKYEPGLLVREKGFTDASCRVSGGMATSHRYTILSNHMKNLSDFEIETNWGLCVANCDARFKVLAVHEHNGKTLILLLHLPAEGWKIFGNIRLNIDEDIVARSIQRFEEQCALEAIPELASDAWLERCSHPIGMDDNGNFFELEFQDEASVFQSVSRTVEQGELETCTNSIGMEFVLIPAGTFEMGSDPQCAQDKHDEMPAHTVTISKSFYLGKYPVTQAQWEAVTGSNPGWDIGPNNPVERVAWDDVQVFIGKLNEKEGGNKYRLPTEAEWEYAARAGASSAYSFGDDAEELFRYAWYKDNSGGTTHPVGQKLPNPWGLHDVHGNVWEWVQDWYGEAYYATSPGTDPKGPSNGEFRVLRGGSQHDGARSCRSAFRESFMPWLPDNRLGFRLAFSVEPDSPLESGQKTPVQLPGFAE